MQWHYKFCGDFLFQGPFGVVHLGMHEYRRCINPISWYSFLRGGVKRAAEQDHYISHCLCIVLHGKASLWKTTIPSNDGITISIVTLLTLWIVHLFDTSIFMSLHVDHSNVQLLQTFGWFPFQEQSYIFKHLVVTTAARQSYSCCNLLFYLFLKDLKITFRCLVEITMTNNQSHVTPNLPINSM